MARKSRVHKVKEEVEEIAEIDVLDEVEAQLDFFKELSEAMSNIGEYTLSDILSRTDSDSFTDLVKEMKEYNADWEPDISEDEMSKRKFIAITKDFMMEVKDIHSIERRKEYIEAQNGQDGFVKYKLYLNEDPNNFGAIKNKSIYYDSEQERDKAFGKIIKQLQILGIILK